MTKTKIRSIIELINNGWRAYSEVPQSAVYDKLGCPYAPEKDAEGKKKKKAKAPFWFYRADSFLCIGCDKQCALFRPKGFIQPLPINYEERSSGEPYTLTPQEMVQRKALLRVDEAAYCLNVSERTVRDWIDMSKLRRTADNPVRIPAEDVAAQMNLFLE